MLKADGGGVGGDHAEYKRLRFKGNKGVEPSLKLWLFH